MSAVGRGTLFCLLVAVPIWLTMPTPSEAQAPLLAYRLLGPKERFYFVVGYMEGFAVAAQIPPERSSALQECFAGWETLRVVDVFDRWMERNPERVRDPDVTARAGLFAALAEACGWKRQ